MSLMKIIEEQRVNLNKLNKKMNYFIENDLNSNKRIMFDREQEIHFLKNFSSSLKFQNTSKYYYIYYS